MSREISCHDEKIGKNGRVYIPSYFKKTMGISAESDIEITFEYGQIILRKFEKNDLFLKPNVGIIRKMGKGSHLSIPKEYLDLLSKEGKSPQKLRVALLDNKLKVVVIK